MRQFLLLMYVFCVFWARTLKRGPRTADESDINTNQSHPSESLGRTDMKQAGKGRLSSLIAAAVVASVLVLPMAPTPALAAAPAGPAMGVQFHATWSHYTDAERVEVLDKMAAAGVKWVRIDIGWTSLQEDGPLEWTEYHLDRLERVVDQARARGIQVLGTLWLTPAWANGGAGSKLPPSNPADYAAAARYVSNYFQGRISAWQVWNEPNHDSFYKGTIAEYVALLKAAYPAFKAGDPSAEVVIGGPSYNDTDWLRKVYEAGAQGSFDVMSTHPYQGIADAPPETPDDGSRYTMAHVTKVYDLMKEFGDGSKKVWFTEFGWSTHDNWAGVDNWERGVTLQQQADFAVRTLKYLAANHPYVTNVFWYNERNHETGDVQYDNYGMLYRDLSPKPIYFALKNYLTSDVPQGEPVPVATPTPGPLPTDAPEPVDTVTPVLEGTFESGLSGWRATDGSLSRTTKSTSGDYAAKVSGHRKDKALVSAAKAAGTGDALVLSGSVRGAKAGQRLRIVIEELRGGSVVGRASTLLTAGTSWKSIPVLGYEAGSADSSFRVKVKGVSRARYFLVDDLALSTSN